MMTPNETVDRFLEANPECASWSPARAGLRYREFCQMQLGIEPPLKYPAFRDRFKDLADNAARQRSD